MSVPVQTCGQNAGVVNDQEVVGAENVRKFPKGAILNASGYAVKPQHACSGAIGQRLFRDQFLRKVVVKIGDQHASIMP